MYFCGTLTFKNVTSSLIHDDLCLFSPYKGLILRSHLSSDENRQILKKHESYIKYYYEDQGIRQDIF